MNKVASFFAKEGWRWILSIGIAFAVWIAVANYNNPTKEKVIRDIPVEITYGDVIAGMDKIYTVTKNDTISLIVTAKSLDLNSITKDDFHASVNMKYHYGIDEAHQAVKIDVEIVNNKNKIISYRTSGSDELFFDLEDVISREYPIEVIRHGDLQGDLALEGDPTTEPGVVTVTAPESMFASINRAAVVVNMDEFTAEVTELPGEINLYDGSGAVIRDENIRLSTTDVMVYAGVLRTKTVNVTVQGVTGSAAAGYRYGGATCDPETITVAGLKADTADLTGIVIGADALDITGLRETKKVEIDITNYLPENVQLVGSDPIVTVTLSIERLYSESFRIPSASIRLIGNDDEAYLYELGENCTLTIMGLQEDLNAFSIDGLSPAVDVTGLPAGEYDLTVSISLPNGYTQTAPSIVHVSVTRVTPETSAPEDTEDENGESAASPDEDEKPAGRAINTILNLIQPAEEA